MEHEATSPLYSRIAERLDALGLSEREASLAAFGNGGTLRNMRTGSSKNPGVDTFQKLAPVLKVAPAWLAFGDEAEAGGRVHALADYRQKPGRAPAATVPLVGEVAAGRWLDVDQAVDEPLYSDGPIPADPAHAPELQFAVQVRGTSINRVAKDGAILVCLDVQRARLKPKDASLVVVERRRHGGSEIERTVKRLRIDGAVHSLWPDSTDPKWQDAIDLSTDDGDETVQVQIIGLVSLVVERLGSDIPATTA